MSGVLPRRSQVDDFKSSAGPDPKDSDFVLNVKKLNPLVGLVAYRSKNLNKVIYQVNTNEDGVIDEKEPVIGYWLDVDPEHVKKHRKSNCYNDRVELNAIEKNYIWGFKATKLTEDAVKFTFMFFDQDPLVFKWDKKHKCMQCYYTDKKKQHHRVNNLYVNATDNISPTTVLNLAGTVIGAVDMTALCEEHLTEIILYTSRRTKQGKLKPDKVKIDVDRAIRLYKERNNK